MATVLRIALAQLNLLVGDIQGNLNKLIEAAHHARDGLKADVIIFPELSITGYPPEDLLLRESFIHQAAAALQTFISEVQGIYCVVSHPHLAATGLYNACSVIYNQQVLGLYSKSHLPNYGVFDEARYFVSGTSPCIISIKGIPTAITICEDLWYEEPVKQAAALGAKLILSPNASPFEVDKHEQRLNTLVKRATSVNLPIVYVNCIGGQDELIFDGGSMVVDSQGALCHVAPFFKESISTIDLEFTAENTTVFPTPFTIPKKEEKIYHALVLGVKDYLKKNGFTGAVIGLSGGIDSALTLAIAVDALGKENVTAVIMPSRYTADISIDDALALANNLGVHHETISIEPSFNSFLESLADKKCRLVEENLQSRCRALLLLGISNKTGRIVLTTSNRSELAVGYSTLFGDMAGGFCVLKDIPKTLVYTLTQYRNQIKPDIPNRILERPPTAELAANQKDEDTLPPYAILDPILELYLNQALDIDKIIAQGFDREIVTKVINLIHKSEYKRRLAPMGPRINHTAFGKDRRYPVSSGFKK